MEYLYIENGAESETETPLSIRACLISCFVFDTLEMCIRDRPYASTVSKTKTASVKYDGSTVGKFYLTGYFAYDGSRAIATDDDYSATGYSGWDYKNASSSHSGAKVSGKCTFYKGSTSKTVSLSMTCSPDGDIS